MRIYISGPISSAVPDRSPEQLKDMFQTCATYLATHYPDLEVVNPLDVNPCPDMSCVRERGKTLHVAGQESGHSWDCWMRYDIIELMKCDAVVRLPNWGLSRGARIEVGLATQLGMKTYTANNQGEVKIT